MTVVADALSRALAQACCERYPSDAGRALAELEPALAVEVIDAQSPSAATRVVDRMASERAAACFAAASEPVATRLLTAIEPAACARVLAHLDDDERARLQAHLPEPRAAQIREVLQYPAGTAGHRMDTRVVMFPLDTTADAALRTLRGVTDRRITDLVLIDEQGLFAGVAPLQDVAVAEPSDPLSKVARRNAPSVQPMTSEAEVVDILHKHRATSLPVLDLDGRVLGILRQDGLLAATEQDATADLARMVGASREERALSTPWFAVRNRLPWLQINLLTAFLASAVVGMFEDTIAKFTALAVLLPVVAGQSGNTGAQALAVTSRALALREIRGFHTLRVLRKEAVCGLLNGLAVAAVTAGSVFVWSQNLGLTLVMFIAMVSAMLIASIAGAVIPIGLAATGRDPATASSIILTTVTDVCGFMLFLGLATLLSSMIAG